MKSKFLFGFFILNCTFLEREEKPPTLEGKYRCGYYVSYLFPDKKVVYPDLGYLLYRKKEIGLRKDQEEKILHLAKECYRICTIKKGFYYQKEREIRQKIEENFYYEKPSLLAKELNQLEKEKKKILKEHYKRYQKGIMLLDPIQRKKWEGEISSFSPFPWERESYVP